MKPSKNKCCVPIAHLTATLRRSVAVAVFAAGWLSFCNPLVAEPPTHTTQASRTPFSRSTAKFKVQRYAKLLMDRYDSDKDGLLSEEEWQAMPGRPEQVDRNSDHQLTVAEFVEHVLAYSARKQLGRKLVFRNRVPATGNSFTTAPTKTAAGTPRRSKMYTIPLDLRPASVPEWFTSQDTNGDGQVSLAEYSPTVEAADVAEFQQLDDNSDGLITSAELARRNQ